ncbi:MAG TPA: RNA 2',3'-cyclic phosphodiesterase [Candidatus Norongarragalinales archaeon]|nr:RNA 2',3'-cyclic phosphodiesterase [Candidatus Norongarragalinales archaeon]
MARCFVAVAFGGEIASRLQTLQNTVKQTGIVATFPKEFHCTLAFLDEIGEPEVEKAKEALATVRFKPAEVSVKKLGFFPNENFIHVFWAGVEGLDELQKQVVSALHYQENFTGHITIARIKTHDNLGRLRDLVANSKGQEFGKTKVDKFFLMKSVLTPAGPVFEVIREYSAVK